MEEYGRSPADEKNNRARIKQYSLQKIDKIMENIYR